MMDKITDDNKSPDSGQCESAVFKPLWFLLGLLLAPLGFALYFCMRAVRPEEAMSVARGALMGLILLCCVAFVFLLIEVVALAGSL